ncbi:hypothetical protein L0337_08780 [candidate division KSB1 bacterium]|nr:hypothetical protein [candidate division KSB1 bacterium]
MRSSFLLLILLVSLTCWTCQANREKDQPQAADSIGAAKISAQAGAVGGEVVRELSEAEADTLLQLEQQIMQQPENEALRRELGRRAIDANSGVIWAVGKGRVNPQASSPSVALSQAEMAATLDASRWAAYLLEWRKTDYATKFGSLQASVPGATVVRKATNDSLCVVLARVPLQRE